MRSTQTAMRGVTMLVWLTMVLLVTECHAQGQTGPAQRSSQPKPIEGVVTAETVAEGLEHPWALAFLPDGRDPGDRASGPAPGRLADRPGIGAAGRRAAGAGPGAGRAARRGAWIRSSPRTG